MKQKKTADQLVREHNIELDFTSVGYKTMFWRDKLNGRNTRIMVGYLVYDEHCSNPIEDCDGSGKFISDRPNYFWHVGRGSDGEPDIEEFLILVARLRGIETEEINDCPTAGGIATEMWEEALARGKIGTRYAVALQNKHDSGYIEHHGDRTINAVWIPDESCLEHINSFPEATRDMVARKAFKDALKEFNMWASGECYGVIVEHFEYDYCTLTATPLHDEQDACWGYIGLDYAEESLEDAFELNKQHYLTSKVKKKNLRFKRKSVVNH